MPTCAVQSIDSVPPILLGPLFDEEAAMWTADLRWNFAPSRGRLETALREGTVNGFVALDEQGPCAYATYSTHDDQGVIGSFFAASRSRGRGLEDHLVTRVLDRLLKDRPRVVDCQTLFSTEPGLRDPFLARGFDSAARIYMTLERSAFQPGQGHGPEVLRTRPTHRLDLRSLSRLIFDAHEVSRANDASSSFDTLDSCTRILRQIMLDEVCGPFDSQASRRIERDGAALAACLLTWPMPGVAHVSEVATLPQSRRKGLARQCLTEALQSAFERQGASHATLSVTASNVAARTLYESVGFVSRIRYHSHVLRNPA